MARRFTLLLLLLLVLADAVAQPLEWISFNTENSGLPSNQVHALAQGRGAIWVGTANGLARFDGEAWITYSSADSPLPEDYVTSLAAEGSNIWVGTREGLVRFDGLEWDVFTTDNSILADDEVLALHAGADGGIWVATPGGLTRVSGSEWTSVDHIFDDLTLAVAVDGQGRMWVGTFNNLQFNGRLRRFDGTQWTLDRLEDRGLSSSFPTALLAEADGSAWLGIRGTAGGAVIHIQHDKWTVFDRFNSGLPPGAVTALVRDGGRIWIGTSSGLASYDGESWDLVEPPNSDIPEGGVSTLYVDGRGNKWMGTLTAGLQVYREGGVALPSEQDPSEESLELQVSPNPVASQAQVRYRVRTAGPVSVALYDVLGRSVSVLLNEHQAPGEYTMVWKPVSIAPGLYLLRVLTADGQQNVSVLLLD